MYKEVEIVITINELTLPGGDVICDADFLVSLYRWDFGYEKRQEIDSIIYLGEEQKELVDQKIREDWEYMTSIMFDTVYW